MNVSGWYINGTMYSVGELPNRYTYSHQMLLLHDVRFSDNGTTYRCFFFKMASEVSSPTVTLTVVPRCELIKGSLFLSLS